jgi:lipopolysaccharide transport system ATP-binding protein
VLGLTKKEIDAKIDEIIDFAEIREFIDMPVQSYSSGMQVRLGFAVATALDPDVLILDEVLAVGDVAFRLKCYQRIDDLRRHAAIILVSHNMPDVGRICQGAVVMERGQSVFQGSALDGIICYNRLNEALRANNKLDHRIRYPVSKFMIDAPSEIAFNSPLTLKISIDSEVDLGPVSITVALANLTGSYAAVGMTNSQRFGVVLGRGLNKWVCRISNIPLRSGIYPLTVHVIDGMGQFIAFEANRFNLRVHSADEPLASECRLVVDSIESAP